MSSKLHILIVEDSEDDAVFVVRELEHGGFEPVSHRVDTPAAFEHALMTARWDVVIADYNLPQFSAIEALETLQKSGQDLPFVIVSGTIGEDVAVAVMKSGAHDYILKNNLTRLVPAVRRELREADARRERRLAECCLASLSKLGQSLAVASTPLDSARVIGNIADELFGWDVFSLNLYSAEHNTMRTVLNVDTVGGRKRDVGATYAETPPSNIARRIIERGAELILRDDPVETLPDAIPIGDRQPSASLMFVPIRNESRVIGVMSIQSYRPKAYDQRALGTLQTLANYCGGALERIKAREELEVSREQLRALAAHLQSVREEERKHIAREIHDEFGQALTGFKMDLAWMRNRMQASQWDDIRDSILEKIKAMGTLLDDASGLVRKLCTELRPGVLDDLGLTAAIEWQAREYQKRTGIACALKLNLEDVPVDPERSTALFRIFQEILTNVARHAQATRVDASIGRANGRIDMEVRDNGRGIPPEKLTGGKSFGLVGMRERALILGGDVHISGAPGKGTTVRVTIPISSTDHWEQPAGNPKPQTSQP